MADATHDVAAFQVVLPNGAPLSVQVVIDARRDVLEALLADLDPADLERTALNRPDFDGDETGGFVAALLREIAERLASA